MHGQVGVIVPVRSAAGPAVLKVSFPHPGNVHEPDAFAAWEGRGAVLLYERDDERFAMLLERARPSTLWEVGDGDQIVAVAGRLSRRLSVAAPAELPRLADQADRWEEELRQGATDFPGAVPDAVLDAALAVVDELGRDQPDLLVHGDFHPRNILHGDGTSWTCLPKLLSWTGSACGGGHISTSCRLRSTGGGVASGGHAVAPAWTGSSPSWISSPSAGAEGPASPRRGGRHPGRSVR
jgi:streptomycin 6-kinase